MLIVSLTISDTDLVKSDGHTFFINDNYNIQNFHKFTKDLGINLLSYLEEYKNEIKVSK